LLKSLLVAREQAPENEHLTMQIAARIYSISTAVDVRATMGDYTLSPAYDLICTALHTPLESDTALD